MKKEESTQESTPETKHTRVAHGKYLSVGRLIKK